MHCNPFSSPLARSRRHLTEEQELQLPPGHYLVLLQLSLDLRIDPFLLNLIWRHAAVGHRDARGHRRHRGQGHTQSDEGGAQRPSGIKGSQTPLGANYSGPEVRRLAGRPPGRQARLSVARMSRSEASSSPSEVLALASSFFVLRRSLAPIGRSGRMGLAGRAAFAGSSGRAGTDASTICSRPTRSSPAPSVSSTSSAPLRALGKPSGASRPRLRVGNWSRSDHLRRSLRSVLFFRSLPPSFDSLTHSLPSFPPLLSSPLLSSLARSLTLLCSAPHCPALLSAQSGLSSAPLSLSPQFSSPRPPSLPPFLLPTLLPAASQQLPLRSVLSRFSSALLCSALLCSLPAPTPKPDRLAVRPTQSHSHRQVRPTESCLSSFNAVCSALSVH